MLRESTFLEDIPEEHRSKFIENKLESQQKLKMLKRQLMTSFPVSGNLLILLIYLQLLDPCVLY